MILFWIRRVVLPHTRTHTGKRTDGDNGPNRTADLIFLGEKSPESIETQGPEGSQSVGKDEVGGSNPPSSSRKHLKSEDFRCFFVTNFRFSMWVKMWVSGLTHTVTHTRKGNNGHKRAGQEALCFLPGFFLSLPYMICSMKFPMVWAASSCFCRVAWV